MTLYTLHLGIYLFVSNRAGILAERLSNFTGVNRKTAQLLARKLPFLIVPGTYRENRYPVEFRADTITS